MTNGMYSEILYFSASSSLFFVSLVGIRARQRRLSASWWDLVATQLPGFAVFSVLADISVLDRGANKYNELDWYVRAIVCAMYLGYAAIAFFGPVLVLKEGLILALSILLGLLLSFYWVKDRYQVKLRNLLKVSQIAIVSVLLAEYVSKGDRSLVLASTAVSFIVLIAIGYLLEVVLPSEAEKEL